ncbi:MAG: helix-turn-helix domain-containing protein [Pirellulales bacterium]|nr:helix-turn-helix domain-containing protein [Pirellulales bacterium]
MIDNTKETIDFRVVELDGIRYVILRETAFHSLCRKAHVDGQVSSADEKTVSDGLDMDRASLARKLVRRRRVAGLSQAELARRAGIRPETLNRLERGRTTPDFATIRKLVVAMNAAEQQQNPPLISTPANKEK